MVSVVRTQGLARLVVVGVAVLAMLGTTVLLARAQEGPVQAADPSDPGSPSYVNYTAPDELGQGAAEPSIGVNHNSGAVMYQAFLETLRVTFDDSADPPSATWEDVSPGTTSVTTLDPILHTDAVTGRTFVSQLLPPCSIYATTDDDGETYVEQTATGCGPGAQFDHQTIVAGGSVDPTPSSLTYQGRSVYYCSQVVAEASCARSIDGGRTFPQGSPTYIIDQEAVPQVGGCAGLHGHLEVGPDGVAYLPNFRCNDGEFEGAGPAIVVSEDDGLTWDIRRIPDGSSDNFDSDPTASVDADGTVYVGYENADNEMFVATSSDAGRTWNPSVNLGAPFGLKNATFPASIAGSGGRAAISFVGTPVEAPLDAAGKPENELEAFDPSQGVAEQGWHLYVATTFDGGQTWETVDVTPDDPVQRGCIFWGSPRDPGDAEVCSNSARRNRADRNLLDFTEMAVDAQGRVLVGYADGCVRTCVDDPAPPPYPRFAEDGETESDFREDVAVIARQTCGRGIFAEFDADPAGPLSACERSAPSPDPTPPVPSEVPTDQPTAAPGPGRSESARTERVAGDERVTTAVAVSQASFPDGTGTVLLARSDLYPDALTGAPLAVDRDAPLLLTDSQALSAATADEIGRLGVDRAVVLGGEQAIGPAVVAELEADGVAVERVAGQDRYATAAEIAAALGATEGIAFLAEGGSPDPARGFPDPLSAAPYAAFLGRPILLTGSDELPSATAAALRDSGIRETVVVGGPVAVSEAVVEQVREAGHGPRRLAGADRYATSVAVSDEALSAGMDTAVLWLATGTNWPDALTAGPAVAAAGDSFLLVDPGNLEDSPATAAAIEARAGRIETVRLLGGTAAVSEQVERQVQETLGSG